MKYCILSILMITLVNNCFSQIEVKSVNKSERVVIGSVSAGFTLTAELSYEINGNDTIYFLLYRNNNYTQIIDYQEVMFKGNDKTIDDLYKLFMSVFTPENIDNTNYQVNFKLGNDDVYVSNYKSFGITCVWFHGNVGYTILTKRQVKKLFNK